MSPQPAHSRPHCRQPEPVKLMKTNSVGSARRGCSPLAPGNNSRLEGK